MIKIWMRSPVPGANYTLSDGVTVDITQDGLALVPADSYLAAVQSGFTPEDLPVVESVEAVRNQGATNA